MTPRHLVLIALAVVVLLSVKVPTEAEPQGLEGAVQSALADVIERDGKLPLEQQRIQHSNDVFEVLHAALVYAFDGKPPVGFAGGLSAKAKRIVQSGPEPEKLSEARRAELVRVLRNR